MLTAEQLKVIKEEYSNMDWDDFRENAGDLITREIEIYDAVVIDGVPALVAEVERLQAEVARYKQVYEICEGGMFKAHDWWQASQAKLDRTELAEVKARMENERLRAVLIETKGDILSIGSVINTALGYGETVDLGNLDQKLHEIFLRLSGETA